MKKLISICLAICIIFSLASTAGAATKSNSGANANEMLTVDKIVEMFPEAKEAILAYAEKDMGRKYISNKINKKEIVNTYTYKDNDEYYLDVYDDGTVTLLKIVDEATYAVKSGNYYTQSFYYFFCLANPVVGLSIRLTYFVDDSTHVTTITGSSIIGGGFNVNLHGYGLVSGTTNAAEVWGNGYLADEVEFVGLYMSVTFGLYGQATFDRHWDIPY